MILKSIRELNDAVPFQPHEIRMAGGTRHRVPHPDFISISPKGSLVVVIDASERPHMLSKLLMEEAVVFSGHGRAKVRRA